MSILLQSVPAVHKEAWVVAASQRERARSARRAAAAPLLDI
jgi:hypothetical protein